MTQKEFVSMKKILSLFFLIAVAVFVLTACSQDDEVANGDEATTVAVATAEDTVLVDVRETTEVPADTEVLAEATVLADTEGLADTEVLAEATGLADGSTRGPISILGNGDFTSENGVVGGTGTADDPYVIAAWEIAVPSGEYYGVRIENVTDHFVLRGLMIQNATQMGGAGIRIGFAAGGAIKGCSISNSMHGIEIMSSTDISIDSCILYVSGRGLRVIGESEEQYRHEIATTNLYNNAPIYYFYGLDGDTISGLKGGHLTVASSRNVTVSNNEIVNGDGMMFAFVEDSTITLNLAHRTANVITDNGMHLYESHNNLVLNNVVKNNRLAGIQLTLATGNSIVDNFAYVNDTGIRVLASDDNSISGNDVYADVTGINLLGGSSGNSIIGNMIHDDNQNMAQGIILEAAFSNTIERNLIYGSEIGLMFEVQASGNTASDNSIVSGGYGLYVSGTNNIIERNLLTQHSRGILFPETFQRSITQGNTFRGNVLADNGNHVYTNLDSTGNSFTENVFLNEGRDQVADSGTDNLWTKNGVGNFWGFNSVADADGDGIGDTPVTVYPSTIDDTAPLASINIRELGLGIVGTLDLGTTTIETGDGDEIQIAAYVADEPYERAVGFRGFPTELITGFPGILFVFDSEVETNFAMSTVPFDLDIVFFNAVGEWVGSTTMTAQATALYTAGAPFQYALELQSGLLEELGIDASSTLVLP
jgi:parallel beta-helix repeat protein